MAEVHCLFAFQHPAPPHTCTRHHHACTEIVFNLGGEGTLFHGGEPFEYGPRSVFTYQPGVPHWVTQRRGGIHLCLGVEGCGAAQIRVGSFSVGKDLAALARAAQTALAAGSQNNRAQIELIAGLIAIHLSARYPRRQLDSLAHQAQAIIDAEYHQPLTVAQIAARLYISPDYLRQVFRKEFGIGPLRYLLQKRIAAATELLRFSSVSIQAVARQCGFDNPFYFSRQFRKLAGHTPTSVRAAEFRRRKMPALE